MSLRLCVEIKENACFARLSRPYGPPQADKLQYLCDEVITFSGEPLEVENISIVAGPAPVYNFEVEGTLLILIPHENVRCQAGWMWEFSVVCQFPRYGDDRLIQYLTIYYFCLTINHYGTQRCLFWSLNCYESGFWLLSTIVAEAYYKNES